MSITMCWADVGEATDGVLKIDQETTEKIVPDQAEMQESSDPKKSYADRKRKPMEYRAWDRVMLKGLAFGKGERFRKSWQAKPEIRRTFQGVSKSWESLIQAGIPQIWFAGTLGEVLSSPGNVKIRSNKNTHNFSQTGLRHPLQVIMSSATSAVTYTSVYTDSEPAVLLSMEPALPVLQWAF
ncbi:hypothetical protein Tco_0471846 [Tanacetum coccineum]